MTTNAIGLTPAVWRVAGRGAVLGLALATWAQAASAQSDDLTKPTSVVEVGAGGVSDGSYKAGEYNGLQDKGGFVITHLDLRGGAAYDSGNARRWSVKGRDLGLETRSLAAEIGAQGKYRLGFGYDELRRNRSDTYQTPYQGAGTNLLTLPAGWQVPTIAGVSGTSSVANVLSARGLVKSIGDSRYIDSRAASPTFGALLTPTSAQIFTVDAAANADVPLFQNYNLSTKRTKYDLVVDYTLNPTWTVGGEFRPEHKDGVKPMGTVSRSTGGDISTVIPDLIDSNTNQIDLSVNFHGAKSFGHALYYGSIFTNNVPYMSWQNWATGPTDTGVINLGTGVLNKMSSAPANTFNQVSGSGGYNLSPTTKLVLNGSFGHNTQNDSFLTSPTTLVVPVSSLDGLVVSEAFGARYTSKPKKALNLTAQYKFDNRDNRTAVHIFQFADAEEPLTVNGNFPASNPLGALFANNANANRAYSKKQNQLVADADYALAHGQGLKGAYEYERINRDCYSSWISCADAATTNEHSLRGEYRTSLAETVTARIGYTYAARRTPDYNENAFLAIVPYANVSPTAATGGATALSFMQANGWNGWGPALGYSATTGNMNLFFPLNNALANAFYANANRISELPGMRRYFVADRNRNKIRTSGTWQATETVSFQGNLDYNNDHYADAVYGLQNNSTWAANVDGLYAVGGNVTLDAFYTYEDLTSGSAGNTYTANSNVATITGAQATATGLSGNACDGYTTLLQRNNNNKLDPCLNWFTDRADKVHSVGVSAIARNLRENKLDVAGNFTLSRANSDNNVTGGNWANNLLVGPAAPPTNIAAYFIAATPLPTVSTDTYELRVNAKYAVKATQKSSQALHVGYTFMKMTSADWAYEGMQFGSLSGVLPTNEQPFNYSVHVVGVSYVISF